MTLGVLALAGCASRRIMVPPRLDLDPYRRVALVAFTIERAKGSLHELATERFAEEVLAAQTGIEVLEVGLQDSLIRRVGETQFGPASAQALGERRGVAAVFAGHLVVSDVKPSASLLGLRVPFVEATVSVELTVRLLSTESGGTVWRASAAATEKVGQIGLVGGEPVFSARDPNDAYGSLVNRLVVAVTHDLRPTWRRQ
ncbi:MAG TPA: hypothetical protein VD793_00280 [Gemmatimonadales bacterium]|nr:hypothetical protein [Gemmatimonadales bacterium]